MADELSKQLIARLFEQGKTGQAFFHRFMRCCLGSDCRRACPNMVKGHGLADVWCVDLGASTEQGKVPLYKSLEEPEFVCPRGNF